MDRATSFGLIAADYERYRPPPPPSVADWLLPEGAQRVADVCAGTGGFSRVLARRVDGVIAVDLDTRMVGRASLSVLSVLGVCGRGEALPVRSSSLDAVLVSSGWHWLDEDAALSEIARALRPGGVLGVVWNGPDRTVGWVAELLGRGYPRRDRTSGPRHHFRIPAGEPFSEPVSRTIEWTLPRTVPELVGLAGTYSRFITLPQPERENLARRVALVAEDRLMQRDQASVELPMRARCWKATRL
jgi:SAM-dependent methyltransferase